MLHIEVPLRKTSNLFFIGAFFNQFLPGTTGGDVVRVIFLMQDHPENKTEGLLSVAVDRLLAVLVLVIMGLLFAWLRSDWFASSFAVGHLMKWFAITLFVMALALVASFVLTSRHLVTLLPRRFPFRRQNYQAFQDLAAVSGESPRSPARRDLYRPDVVGVFCSVLLCCESLHQQGELLGYDLDHASGDSNLFPADQPQRDRRA